MKKLLMALIVLLSISTYTMAEQVVLNHYVVDLSDVDKSVEYITVITRHSEFRIYPCGRIDKHVWKEIHENEDILTTTHGWIVTDTEAISSPMWVVE